MPAQKGDADKLSSIIISFFNVLIADPGSSCSRSPDILAQNPAGRSVGLGASK
jgi:hypothetical protein